MEQSRGADPPNCVGEWFGHRVYPVVRLTEPQIDVLRDKLCPFLTGITDERRQCIKPSSSSGVCTINSRVGGTRQDWLVCPYRALDPELLTDVARRLFDIGSGRQVYIAPAPTLRRAEVRQLITDTVARGDAALVYLQDKLGGEVSLSGTPRSPELAFDTTIVEVIGPPDRLTLARYAILELQTMDFHGSYRHAVKNLEDALRLHATNFPDALRENPSWLAERIEGPNIANVFKRTFYQMVLKFQIAGHGECAGSAMAIPASVWNSWQRHLGAPDLIDEGDGIFALWRPGERKDPNRPPAWIYVFDLDVQSPISPNPIVISKRIATDAESIAYYALEAGGSADRLLASIRRRLASWWPELT